MNRPKRASRNHCRAAPRGSVAYWLSYPFRYEGMAAALAPAAAAPAESRKLRLDSIVILVSLIPGSSLKICLNAQLDVSRPHVRGVDYRPEVSIAKRVIRRRELRRV